MYMGLKCQSDSIWGPIVNGADISGLKSQRELIWDWTQMGLKSVNLQYNTLGRLDDRTNELSTKHLMFQVLFFFMISCRILRKNTFNLFVYFFKKNKSKEF